MAKSKQQEQSEIVALIIKQLSQEVTRLKAHTDFDIKLYHNGLNPNKKLQANFDMEFQRVRDEVKDYKKQLMEHLEKFGKAQEQLEKQITAPKIIELEDNERSLTKSPPTKHKLAKHQKQCNLCSHVLHFYKQRAIFRVKQNYYLRIQTNQEHQAIKKQRLIIKIKKSAKSLLLLSQRENIKEENFILRQIQHEIKRIHLHVQHIFRDTKIL